jgi:catechol 2,3-dioxygenase-like lactoylglutathione lyase family enzyme
MQLLAMDHLSFRLPSLADLAPWERLGFRLTPVQRQARIPVEYRLLVLGEAERPFRIEFTTHLESPVQTPQMGTLVLQVAALDPALAALKAHGLSLSDTVTTQDPQTGQPRARWARLEDTTRTIVPLVIMECIEAPAETFRRYAADGYTAHRLAIRRLDHLAAITPDLAAATAFWTEVLGVSLAGTIQTPVMRIHPLRIGDANLELIGPANAESPLAQRPPGLTPMIAVEVPDLVQAIAEARAAGFTLSDPTTGVLPGTRTATISADQLAGLGLQLLEYVRT